MRFAINVKATGVAGIAVLSHDISHDHRRKCKRAARAIQFAHERIEKSTDKR